MIALPRLYRATGRRLLQCAACLVPTLLLAGCETINSIVGMPQAPPPCPRVAKVDDAATLTHFVGDGRDLTDVDYEAEIGRIVSTCDYDSDNVDMVVRVEFIASRGPADQQRRAPLTYFVAVARTDQTILGRASFDTLVEFPGNVTRAAVAEELEQEIPLKQGESWRSIIVWVGFELTPEQLEFNRQQRP
jgi:hypothetical protein